MDQTQASPDQSIQPGTSADPSQQQGAPLTVIEVTVAQDGSITVEQESGSQEGQEESSGEDSGSQAVPVKNSAEAASLVKQMLDAATQTTAQQTAQAKNEQTAGYQGA